MNLEVPMFDREELQRIEVKAREASRAVRNECWKRALQDLEYAANVVDAFEARSTDCSQSTEV